jgi:hypothetical protein
LKLAGIDYSLCSPAITLHTGDGFSFTQCKSYFLTETKKHATIYNSSGMYCEGSEHKEWETPQFGRGEDRYDKISNWALSLVHDCDLVFLEDYALGAKGKVFNLGENGGLLKWKMWKAGVPFHLVGPTVVKKFASGKGNADKDKMYDAFLKETGANLMKEISPDSKKVTSPVSDIVDSYFICKYAYSILLQN